MSSICVGDEVQAKETNKLMKYYRGKRGVVTDVLGEDDSRDYVVKLHCNGSDCAFLEEDIELVNGEESE